MIENNKEKQLSRFWLGNDRYNYDLSWTDAKHALLKLDTNSVFYIKSRNISEIMSGEILRGVRDIN